jgi:hypothetical protein
MLSSLSLQLLIGRPKRLLPLLQQSPQSFQFFAYALRTPIHNQPARDRTRHTPADKPQHHDFLHGSNLRQIFAEPNSTLHCCHTVAIIFQLGDPERITVSL